MPNDATSAADPEGPPGAVPQLTRSARARELLPDDELMAWRALLEVHATATRRLEAELVEKHSLPLAWYDVLVQLVEAPGHRLRMGGLADALLFSRSGLTRLVDRMVADGLVVRERADVDLRGWYVVMTEAGYRRLRGAAATHLRGIHEHVTGALRPGEATELTRLLCRLGE